MYGDDIYGSIIYADTTNDDGEIKDLVPDLMGYLPLYYKKSDVMQNIQNANAKEIALLDYSIADLENQLFIDTATWGLRTWEKQLKIYTDLSKPYTDRRENVKARLRGSGTSTKEMIKNVAEAFSGGEVAVIENNSTYSFTVQFIGIKGIPKNMQGLIDTIDIIKPAHLEYSFKYTFMAWSMIECLAWDGVGTKTWNDLKIYE